MGTLVISLISPASASTLPRFQYKTIIFTLMKSMGEREARKNPVASFPFFAIVIPVYEL